MYIPKLYKPFPSSQDLEEDFYAISSSLCAKSIWGIELVALDQIQQIMRTEICTWNEYICTYMCMIHVYVYIYLDI